MQGTTVKRAVFPIAQPIDLLGFGILECFSGSVATSLVFSLDSRFGLGWVGFFQLVVCDFLVCLVWFSFVWGLFVCLFLGGYLIFFLSLSFLLACLLTCFLAFIYCGVFVWLAWFYWFCVGLVFWFWFFLYLQTTSLAVSEYPGVPRGSHHRYILENSDVCICAFIALIDILTIFNNINK